DASTVAVTAAEVRIKSRRVICGALASVLSCCIGCPFPLSGSWTRKTERRVVASSLPSIYYPRSPALFLPYNPEADDRSIGQPPLALGVLRIGGVPGGRRELAGGTGDVCGPVVVRAAADHRLPVCPKAPFRHIAEHVVQAPGVRFPGGNRMRFVVGVFPRPGVL